MAIHEPTQRRRLSPELLEELIAERAAADPAPHVAPPPAPPPAPRAPQRRQRSIPLGVLCILFGIALWLLGAHYSIDGWVIGVNLIADATRIPFRLSSPEGLLRPLLILALGLIYSLAEVFARPVRGAGVAVWCFSALGLALVHLTDVGTTILALLTPASGAWAVAHWLAAQSPLAAICAVILTYLPEGLIITGIHLIIGIRTRKR